MSNFGPNRAGSANIKSNHRITSVKRLILKLKGIESWNLLSMLHPINDYTVVLHINPIDVYVENDKKGYFDHKKSLKIKPDL